jgi:hypothetical protein
VGAFVGASLGAIVGASVGVSLGAVGDSVGDSVGARVAFVGADVGASVGNAVGANVLQHPGELHWLQFHGDAETMEQVNVVSGQAKMSWQVKVVSVPGKIHG